MASATTTVGNLINILNQLPTTNVVSFFSHGGDTFSKQQAMVLQSELAAYTVSKVGNPKAATLIPVAQMQLQMLQSALQSGTTEEIMQASNQAAAAVNAVGAC